MLDSTCRAEAVGSGRGRRQGAVAGGARTSRYKANVTGAAPAKGWRARLFFSRFSH